MTYQLELWRCLHYAEGSETACNRGVYTEPGAPTPPCTFEPEARSFVERHGTKWMESVGLFEFKGEDDESVMAVQGSRA